MFSVRTEAGLQALNDLLAKQSYLSGAEPSADDLSRQGELRVVPGTDYPHARRWYEHIGFLKRRYPNREWSGAAPAAGADGKPAKAAKASGVDPRSDEEKAAAAAKRLAFQNAGKGAAGDGKGKDVAQLDNVLKGAVMGKVVTRFPPEPSGFLHIGHARAALTNHYYAKEYKGKLIIRFDDTNPSKEKAEFEESIVADLKTLGIVGDVVSHTSDHFPKIQELMEKCIKAGHMYCDDTEMMEMRDQRDKGIESVHRNDKPEKVMEHWNEMLKGSPEGIKFCVRGKMDMQEKNKCLRDPVFYRCKVDVPHHRTGTKYKAYPTYDFACPVVDSVEGVTHPLRTIEYRDRDPMYQWVLQVCGFGEKHIVEFSKSQFMYTILSKRKLQQLVDLKAVTGWDDPRMPTVQGILRRGMTVDALLEFVKTQGASKATNLMSWDKIWAINKQKIDGIVPRYAAIEADDAIKFELSDGPADAYGKMIPRHQKNTDLGERLQFFSKTVLLKRQDFNSTPPIENGEEITLLHWGNAIVQTITKGKDGKITGVKGKLNLDGDVKKTKWKLHWVPEVPQVTNFILREYDHVLTKPKLEDGDEIADCINKDCMKDFKTIGDPMLKNLQKGDMLQLERRGYFIVDKVAFRDEPMIMIEVPDGKTKTMGGDARVEAGQDAAALKNKVGEGKQKKGEAAKVASPAKAGGAPAAGGAVDEAALEALKTQIMDKKKALKDAGMSGGAINKDPEIIKMVAQMQELKSGAPAPAAAAPAAPAKPAAKPPKGGAAKAADRPLDDVARLDIRVGKIVKVWPHAEADGLWCEEIDLGEEKPRTIASGLRKHVSEAEMLNAMVIVLCNLKPRNMKGFPSQGMVMCASGPDKIELLQVPAGAKIGERITIEGYTGDADEKLNEKEGKAPLVAMLPDLKTNDAKKPAACFKGVPFMTSKGAITAPTLKNTDVR